LYEETSKRDFERYKDYGRLLGVKFDNEPDQTGEQPKMKKKLFVEQAKKNTMLFRDPKDYENMPQEERDMLTSEMKMHWSKKLTGEERTQS